MSDLWRCVCGRLQPLAGHEPGCPWQYMPTSPPSAVQIERGKRIAWERGWLVGGRWIWEDE